MSGITVNNVGTNEGYSREEKDVKNESTPAARQAHCIRQPAQREARELKNVQVVSKTNFEKIPGVAQYGRAKWDNLVGTVSHVTLEEAQQIAADNKTITYFFYMNRPMVLETDKGYDRVFFPGQAVFFSGTPWWGSASGFSDGYIKK